MSYPTIALVGNPNCGKTTLFNALTGTWQSVGNWAGVTVERKVGYFCVDGSNMTLVDLPGSYSLTTLGHGPEDERLTAEALCKESFSFVLNVIDAANLERNLYLTLQCLEQNLPVIIALNRIDIAKEQGDVLCVETLSSLLGVPVVPLIARQHHGIENLKTVLAKSPVIKGQEQKITYPSVIESQLEILAKISEQTQEKPMPRYQLVRALEGEGVSQPALAASVAQAQQHILEACQQPADVIIASTRYQFIEKLVAQVKKKNSGNQKKQDRLTQQLDSLVCHRLLGFPVFLGVMYALFFFAINVGGAFQDFFELSAQTFFVHGLAQGLAHLSAPPWLMAILVSGLGNGLCTVLTFVPVLGAMFFALAFLEDCGYMARAAFVMDRIMRALGLPGKSFVPMIVGFGCNVPAIMGARTLDNKRDRILTVMMSPFMSCGARLAIFTVFVAAFFPEGGQNIIFLLYLIGIGMAVLTGLLLKKTLLKGELTPLLLEMPDYQLPHWQSLMMHAWHRLRRFVVNAGKLILPTCLVLGLLNNIDLHGRWLQDEKYRAHSVLAMVGQKVVPAFAPMGIEEENWPAAVGLLTGIMAKEVVIGTLNSLYGQTESGGEKKEEVPFSFTRSLTQALWTIPENLIGLGHAWQNPVAAKMPEAAIESHAFGQMVKCFNGQANAFAYLLFVLLYFPCISATSAMVREVQKGWTLFSVCWTTGLAYAVATVYYQCATFEFHPGQSSLWVSIWLGSGVATFWGIRRYSKMLPKILPTRIVIH